MTLFEILLVLVLLVVISSLAMPVFEGAFSSMRLRRASDKVLAAWTELRVLAIQTGRPHQFQFQTETGHYRLRHWQGYLAESIPEELPDTASSTYGEWQPYEAELPKEIEFYQGDSLLLESGAQAQVGSLVDGSSSAWSEPIIFFPDGSTTSASLLLKNENNLVQRVTLRDLTGVGRASEVLTLDEARRLKAR